MLSLYYIFEKNVYTIRHAMGAFGMAPMGSGSTKQCYCSITGWSLESFFLSLHSRRSQNHELPVEIQCRLETGQRGPVCDSVLLLSIHDPLLAHKNI